MHLTYVIALVLLVLAGILISAKTGPLLKFVGLVFFASSILGGISGVYTAAENQNFTAIDVVALGVMLLVAIAIGLRSDRKSDDFTGAYNHPTHDMS